MVVVREEQSLYEQLSGGFPTAQESRTTAISVSCAGPIQQKMLGRCVWTETGIYKVSRGEAKKLLNHGRKARNNLRTWVYGSSIQVNAIALLPEPYLDKSLFRHVNLDMYTSPEPCQCGWPPHCCPPDGPGPPVCPISGGAWLGAGQPWG